MSHDDALDEGGLSLRAAPVIRAAEGVVESFALGDVEAFLGYLTEDVVFEPPPFVLGKRVLQGHDGVRGGFAELARLLGTDNRIRSHPIRYCIDRADPDRLLAMTLITIIRPDGEHFRTEATPMLTARGGKIAEYRSWPSFEEGLAHLEDPIELEP